MATPEPQPGEIALPPASTEVGGWPVSGRGTPELTLVQGGNSEEAKQSAEPPKLEAPPLLEAVEWDDTPAKPSPLERAGWFEPKDAVAEPTRLTVVADPTDTVTQQIPVRTTHSASGPERLIKWMDGSGKRPIAEPRIDDTSEIKADWPTTLTGDHIEEIQSNIDEREGEIARGQRVQEREQKREKNQARLERLQQRKEQIHELRQSLGDAEKIIDGAIDRFMTKVGEGIDYAKPRVAEASKVAGREVWRAAKGGAHRTHEAWKARNNEEAEPQDLYEDQVLDGEALDQSLIDLRDALDKGDLEAARSGLDKVVSNVGAQEAVYSSTPEAGLKDKIREGFAAGRSMGRGEKSSALHGLDEEMSAARQGGGGSGSDGGGGDDKEGIKPKTGEMSDEDREIWDRYKVLWMTLGAQLANVKRTGEIPDDWRSSGGIRGPAGSGSGSGTPPPAPPPAPAPAPTVPTPTAPPPPPSGPRGPEVPTTSSETEKSKEKKRRKLLKKALAVAALAGAAVGGAMLSKYGLHINMSAYGHALHINWNGWLDTIKAHLPGSGGGNRPNSVPPEGFHQVHLKPGDTVWDETAKALGHQPTHSQVGEVLRDNGMQFSGGGPGIDAHQLPIGTPVNIPNNLGG